jgi:hypothetical protein
MGIIRIPLRFEGSLGEKMVYALFDSGATFSCLRSDIAAQIEEAKALRRPMEVATASEGHFVKINEALRADFY